MKAKRSLKRSSRRCPSSPCRPRRPPSISGGSPCSRAGTPQPRATGPGRCWAGSRSKRGSSPTWTIPRTSLSRERLLGHDATEGASWGAVPRRRKRGRIVSPPNPPQGNNFRNRPGRTRTCNPRFWSPPAATPASQRLLIFKDLAPTQQRRRRWTAPALALILALSQNPRGELLYDYQSCYL
jgi:hypothetical protein